MKSTNHGDETRKQCISEPIKVFASIWNKTGKATRMLSHRNLS